MKLHELKPPPGAVKKPKRVGRGPGSGHGKTSCRGHKGCKARSGYREKPAFEGGQMPLFRRLPKRGFKNIFKKEYAVINLSDLGKFNPNEEVSPQSLLEKKIIKELKDGVKLLGDGEIFIPLTVKVHQISKKAKEKIEKAGGIVQVL